MDENFFTINMLTKTPHSNLWGILLFLAINHLTAVQKLTFLAELLMP